MSKRSLDEISVNDNVEHTQECTNPVPVKKQKTDTSNQEFFQECQDTVWYNYDHISVDEQICKFRAVIKKHQGNISEKDLSNTLCTVTTFFQTVKPFNNEEDWKKLRQSTLFELCNIGVDIFES